MSNSRGSMLVERMIAVAVFGILASAAIVGIIYGREAASTAGMRAKAAQLMDEGLEAVRSIRDTNFSTLSDGTHGLIVSSNAWTLSSTSDTHDMYRREIAVSSIDSNTKQIVSSVFWQQTPIRTGSVSSVTYLTNWRKEFIGDWGGGTPVVDGTLNLGGAQDTVKVAWEGNYAYVVRSGGTPNFFIINVSDPAHPTIAGSMTIANVPMNVAVSGNYAYVVSMDDMQELRIIDVTNKAAPVQRGYVDVAGNGDSLGVFVANNKAYIVREHDTGTSPEFAIINVTNPAAPTVLGTVGLLNKAGKDVIVIGNYAYVAAEDNQGEFKVVDVTTSTAPVVVKKVDIVGNDHAYAVAGNGNTIFIGKTNGYLYSFDVTNPPDPVLRGSCNVGGGAGIWTVAIEPTHTYAYVGTDDYNGGFNVVDVSNLTALTLKKQVDLSQTVTGLVHDYTRDRVYAVGRGSQNIFKSMRPQ